MSKTVSLRGREIAISGSDMDPYFQTLETQVADMDLFSACLDAAPGVMYDIGANIGVTACAAHDRPIYAFEPSPSARTWLECNLADRADVCIVPLALGRMTGAQRFAENELLAGSHVDDQGALVVGMHRLDDWRRETGAPLPAFVKIDVVGHELAVLDGGRDTLATGALVLAEVNPWTLDAFCGNSTTVFLTAILERFGGFVHVVDGQLVHVTDRAGVLALTYSLLIADAQPWTDIAFSAEPRRISLLKDIWFLSKQPHPAVGFRHAEMLTV